MDDYQAQALRTKSDNFYGDAVPLDQLRADLRLTILAGKSLDRIKKSLFYGKPYETSLAGVSGNVDRIVTSIASEVQSYLTAHVGIEYSLCAAIDVVHCIIGKITEAAELAEALLKVCEGGEFDPVNFLEEIGDGQWYDAIGVDALEHSFDYVQRTNIAKLRARFPEKFTEHDAEHRDLNAERATLEGKTIDGQHWSATEAGREAITGPNGMYPLS